MTRYELKALTAKINAADCGLMAIAGRNRIYIRPQQPAAPPDYWTAAVEVMTRKDRTLPVELLDDGSIRNDHSGIGDKIRAIMETR